MDQISFFNPLITKIKTLSINKLKPNGITNCVKYNGVCDTDSESISISYESNVNKTVL